MTEHTFASAEYFAVRGDEPDPDAWRGRSMSVTAPYPVEAGRVADFCAMLHDDNRLYWDAEFATRVHGRPIAPPATLTAWRFMVPWLPSGRPEHGPPYGCEVPLPVDTLINVGFTSSFQSPIAIGDRLTYTDTISAISGPKLTALGTGWFLTTDTVVTGQDDRRLATYRNVMFRYSAPSRGEPGPERERHAPEALPTELPDVGMPVTATLCAQLTAATRDYFPGHHDATFAREQGVADVYPNTGFYCGLADLVALRWAGDLARVVTRDLRMLRPAPVGQTLRTGGTVVRRHPVGDRDRLDLAIRIETEAGPVARCDTTIEVDR